MRVARVCFDGQHSSRIPCERLRRRAAFVSLAPSHSSYRVSRINSSTSEQLVDESVQHTTYSTTALSPQHSMTKPFRLSSTLAGHGSDGESSRSQQGSPIDWVLLRLLSWPSELTLSPTRSALPLIVARRSRSLLLLARRDGEELVQIGTELECRSYRGRWRGGEEAGTRRGVGGGRELHGAA